MLFRVLRSSAIRSAALRVNSSQAFRSPLSQSPIHRLGLNACANPCAWRSLATETGFLDKTDITGRVLEVVRKFEKVHPEKVTESSHFVNDLGLDSLDTVELVMAFEDEFAIEIPDAEAEKIHSCEDAVTYLASNVHAK